MDSSTDTAKKLDRAASRQTLEQLAARGVLGEDAFSEARSMLEPDGWASLWASRALLFFGAALTLAGIIFFFTTQWNRSERAGPRTKLTMWLSMIRCTRPQSLIFVI